MKKLGNKENMGKKLCEKISQRTGIEPTSQTMDLTQPFARMS